MMHTEDLRAGGGSGDEQDPLRPLFTSRKKMPHYCWDVTCYHELVSGSFPLSSKSQSKNNALSNF